MKCLYIDQQRGIEQEQDCGGQWVHGISWKAWTKEIRPTKELSLSIEKF